jgi:hypothetical protein
MNNNRIDHSNCSHDRTARDRAACRASRSSRQALKADLIRIFNEANYIPSENYWIWYAARHFGSYTGDDLDIAAGAILSYFLPSGDDAQDANRRRNGYTITEDIYTMLRITLRAAS